MLKFLVVGAGFAGATLARCLAEKGYHIDVIDKRGHLGGNAYDYIDEDIGIRVHKYGPHIFHTNNKDVVDFLSRFTEWIPYKHKVKARIAGLRDVFVTMPPNRETKETLAKYNLDMIDTLYRPYTEKMWDKKLEEVDPSITDRVKARDDDNEYYFPNDEYQFMPRDGYTSLIHNMLCHPAIKVSLNIEYESHMENDYDHVFNSMPIDEYYKEFFGPLEYRSILFAHDVINKNNPLYLEMMGAFKGIPVINSTATKLQSPETRRTFWSQFPNNINTSFDVVTTETPCKYVSNNSSLEKLYPVKDIKGVNRDRYERYKSIPNDKVTFIGRLGNYVYIDMHQAVNMSMQLAKKYPDLND